MLIKILKAVSKSVVFYLTLGKLLTAPYFHAQDRPDNSHCQQPSETQSAANKEINKLNCLHM